MESLIEKLKSVDKKVLIGAGIGIAAVLIAIIVGIVVLVTGGGKEESKAGTYTIEVITEGQMALEEIGVRVYADEKQEDLVEAGTTDKTGKISFEAENAVGAFIVLEDVPRGYKYEETYEIKDFETQIVLSIELLSEDELDGVTFELGDVFVDMSVTAADGNTYKISDLLKEKKAVVLNFWYLNCAPCKMEFPYLQMAYNKYKEDIEVLAVNPVDGDDTSIKELQESLGLNFPMAKCDASWEQIMKITAYPTTVVIDQYGTIAFIHKGAVTEEGTFEKVFEYFISDSYKQTTIKSIDDIAALGEGDGSKGNPYNMIGTEFDAVIPGEGLVYYQMYKVNGMVLTINDADAYVVYGDEEYKAEDGVVTVPLVIPDTYTPAEFAIGNTSKEEKTFKVSLGYPAGTQGNPMELALGEFTAKVAAGNDQGVYYTYTATETGVFTVTLLSATEGITYDYSLYNLNTYAMRTLGTEGTADANGNKTVSVEVNAGDVVQVSVGTLPNEENEYPAGEFKLMAAFGTGVAAVDPDQKIEYSVTVKDTSGNAISGVTVSISGDGIENTVLTTNKKGVAKTTLAAGTYTAIVSAPTAYKTDSTEYKLTADKPTVTVKLEKKSTTEKTYTVKVVNESSKAMSGVLVTVGDSYGTTDSNGKVTFKLVENNYTATASYSGYQTTSKSFGSSTSVTITMKKETTTSNSNAKTYTVEVVDYAGNPIKDTAVSFLSGGKIVATSLVGSNGKATASLDKGNYTVEIKFPNDTDYGYDKSTASLTSSKLSTKVVAAPKADTSKTTSVYDGAYTMQNLYTGGTYLEMQSNTDNYFVFKPKKAGKYQISTTDKNAKVSYVGTTGYFNEDPSYSGNSCEVDIYSDQVKAGMQLVVSVTGTSECIVVIERTGAAGALTTYKDYAAKTTPKAFTLTGISGKTQKFVDVTASSFKIVLGSDGYYHKGSATGPIMYVVLDSNAQYVSMKDLTDNGPLRSPSKGEDYTNCMIQYVNCVDATYGVYPLTEDLKYMFQQGGKTKGWWDKSVEGGYYLFGSKKVNTDIAWMFECCWWE